MALMDMMFLKEVAYLMNYMAEMARIILNQEMEKTICMVVMVTIHCPMD